MANPDGTIPPLCPYCQQPARLVHGLYVYPHRPDLQRKRFWVCDPCNARVGCHASTHKPFGTLANAQLRQLRKHVHAKFDPLWHEDYYSRSGAYARLAAEMGIAVEQCHMGMFTAEQCTQALHALACIWHEIDKGEEP